MPFRWSPTYNEQQTLRSKPSDAPLSLPATRSLVVLIFVRNRLAAFSKADRLGVLGKPTSNLRGADCRHAVATIEWSHFRELLPLRIDKDS
jgi:hypothetical protein